MIRRSFLKHTIQGAAAVPALANGLPYFLGQRPSWTSILEHFLTETDHVLVLVRMDGGNDGLNTVIPLDQYDRLANLRREVILPENKILPLDGTDKVGFHPAMRGLQELYNDGKLTVIQSVGYPNPNFSHFRSTDIWMTGADSDEVLNTGWMGRYLHYEYPNYPENFPNPNMPDPLAIEIGALLSLTFQGPFSGMGMAVSNPADFYRLVQGIQTPAPNTPAGDQLKYVRLIARQSNLYGDGIKAAFERGNNLAAYPQDNPLAEQLKIVAKLISGGLKTRVYMVSIGGFDTHDSQVEVSDHTIGEHAELLQYTSDAIAVFMEDVRRLGLENRVMGMTFSEFGRRIISNFSNGTDHGSAAPMFIFGKLLHPGILGDNPEIPLTATAADNLPMQYDFRSVYATLLKDWFCVPEADLESILLQNFQRLPIVNSPDCISTNIHEANQAAGKALLRCYPNPFTAGIQIEFETGGGHTMIQVFNAAGQLIASPVNKSYQAGKYSIWWPSDDLPAGTYYVRLQNGLTQQVKPAMKVN